jgi:hypothetical protein
MRILRAFQSIATRYRACTRSALTPCVPVASVVVFQRAKFVSIQLCFAFFLPMIAQLAHNAVNVHIEFMRQDRICGLLGGYHSEGRTG